MFLATTHLIVVGDLVVTRKESSINTLWMIAVFAAFKIRSAYKKGPHL